MRFYSHYIFHNTRSLQVRKEAVSRLSPAHRKNHTAVLGATTLEFGLYYRQTFKWALENATGWVVGVVAQILEEESQDSGSTNIGSNKRLLQNYALSFPKLKSEIDFKSASLKSERMVRATGDIGFTLVGFGEFRSWTWRDVCSSNSKEHMKLCQFVLEKKDVRSASSTLARFQRYIHSLRSSKLKNVGSFRVCS